MLEAYSQRVQAQQYTFSAVFPNACGIFLVNSATPFSVAPNSCTSTTITPNYTQTQTIASAARLTHSSLGAYVSYTTSASATNNLAVNNAASVRLVAHDWLTFTGRTGYARFA